MNKENITVNVKLYTAEDGESIELGIHNGEIIITGEYKPSTQENK